MPGLTSTISDKLSGRMDARHAELSESSLELAIAYHSDDMAEVHRLLPRFAAAYRAEVRAAGGNGHLFGSIRELQASPDRSDRQAGVAMFTALSIYAGAEQDAALMDQLRVHYAAGR